MGDRCSGLLPELSAARRTAGAPSAGGQPAEPKGESVDHRDHDYTRQYGDYAVPLYLPQRSGKEALQPLLERRDVVLEPVFGDIEARRLSSRCFTGRALIGNRLFLYFRAARARFLERGFLIILQR